MVELADDDDDKRSVLTELLYQNKENNMPDPSVDSLITVLGELITKEQDILDAIASQPNSGNNPELAETLTIVISARENIYQTILAILETDEGSFDSSTTVFGDQLATLAVLERSLNDTKTKLNEVQELNVKKLRLIEINDYYGAKYTDQKLLMIYVVWFSIHIILLCIGRKFFPSMMSQNVFIFCSTGSLLVFLFYFFLPKYFDISFRDNMNYQEYAWGQYNNPSDIDLTNPDGTNPWAASTCNC